jgi:hypothetical protein
MRPTIQADTQKACHALFVLIIFAAVVGETTSSYMGLP